MKIGWSPTARASAHRMSAADLRAQLGQFHPPQGYIRLSQHPQMLAVCERAAAETPIRQLSVDH